jgi:hypothetical protein
MEKTSTRIISNLLYRCISCHIVLTTELNLSNLEKDYSTLFKNNSLNKNEFIFFVKKKEDFGKVNNLLYEINFKKKKFYCKLCKYEIGYYSSIHLPKEGSKFLGITSLDKIYTESITHAEENVHELNVVSKFVVENSTLIKSFKYINEIVTSYAKDFYRKEFIECTEQMEKMKITSEKISKEINLSANSLNQN